MRNYSFSSAEDFGSNAQFKPAYVESDNIASIIWEKDGNVSPIDQISPVIQMSERPYYTTSLAPGVEWVEVELEYSDDSGASSTGHRRLRLIPTSVIETGGDKRVDVFYDGNSNETSPYDHKEGFATTYLDAATLQSYLESNTVHPEALKTFEQIVSQQYSNGIISGTMELPFNSTVKNLAVTASMTDQNGNLASIDNLFEKLNGTQRFEAQDCGIYKIVYRASLSDGRYLSIGKKLIVVGPWSVVYNYNYDGLLAGDKISPDSVFYIQSNLMDFNGFVFEGYDSLPVRDGYRFAYWSLDKDGKCPVTQEWFDTYADRVGMLDRNVELYAQWNGGALLPSNEVALIEDPDIGHIDGMLVGEKETISSMPGDRLLINAAIPPERFVFAEWRIESGDATVEYIPDANVYLVQLGVEDAHLKAQYHQNVFSIIWVDGHTGEVVKTNDTVELGTSVMPPVPPEHLGYAFAGYDSDAYKDVQEDLTITLLYDALIEMPETGNAGVMLFAAGGMLLVTIALILAYKRYRRE